MFEYNFSLSSSPDRLKLYFPARQRILPGLLVLLFSAALFRSFILNDGSFIIPLIFLLISLPGFLYTEAWVFSRSSNSLTHFSGILFLVCKKKISFDEIESFVVTDFTRGKLTNYTSKHNSTGKNTGFREISGNRTFFHFRKISKLSIVLDKGKIKDIEILPALYKKKLEQKGMKISEFCSKPLLFGIK